MVGFVEHSVRTLVGQRAFGIALGCEDLIDRDMLRGDPMMAVLAGKLRAKRRNCAPVAGKSTLNRLELGGLFPSGDSKLVHDGSTIEDVSVTLFLDAHEAAPERAGLDFDATGDPVHGSQEGRFFHGYYDCYCYLPLDVSCGRRLPVAQLRPAHIDGAAEAVKEAARLVALLRARWPDTRIVLRADSGFAREASMAWCEANGVDHLFGLARSERPVAQVADALAGAEADSRESGAPARRFADFMRSTRDSRSRERRVVAKPEWTRGKANSRFVVASLAASAHDARSLYEDLYCQRREMENRIEECQLDPFADGASAHGMRANRLRLRFASMAYVLALRLVPPRPRPHPPRRRHLRKPAHRTAQDRRMGPCQRPPHQDCNGHEPSLPGRIPSRPKAIIRRRNLKRRTTHLSLQRTETSPNRPSPADGRSQRAPKTAATAQTRKSPQTPRSAPQTRGL